MSLRQAPRFQAWFNHLEGREVMVMSRHDWEQANELREGEMAPIDLSRTPIASVARDSRIEAAVVVRKSPVEDIRTSRLLRDRGGCRLRNLLVSPVCDPPNKRMQPTARRARSG